MSAPACRVSASRFVLLGALFLALWSGSLLCAAPQNNIEPESIQIATTPNSTGPITATAPQLFAHSTSTLTFASVGPISGSSNGAAPFTNCPVPCTGQNENEPCGTGSNNGCNAGPFSSANFVAATCGQSYCGTVWAEGGSRDTDYYLLQLSEVTTITAELITNAPVVMVLVEIDSNCADIDIFDVAYQNGNCAQVTASGTVPGGLYYVFIAPDPGNGTGLFSGLPCGSGNDYELTITCSSPCQLAAGGTPEGEAAPATLNNGCDLAPEVFAPITDGAMIRGTAWAHGGDRDRDSFQFTVAGSSQIVEATLTSEFPGALRLEAAGCTGQVLDLAHSVSCNPGAVATIVPPGDYVISVFPADPALGEFSAGIPFFDPSNEYLLSFTLTPATTNCDISCMGTPEIDACGGLTDGGCENTLFLPVALDGTPSCGHIFADNDTRDVDWYEFGVTVPTTVTATLTSEFPAQLMVGRCAVIPGFVVTIDEDNGSGCSADPAEVVLTLDPGSYIVIVTLGTGPLGTGDVFNGYPCGTQNDYSLTLTTNPPLPSCTVSCGGLLESEPCGTATNNGCNLLPAVFETIEFGQTRCGTVWADSLNRDSDWYHFSIDEPSSVEWTIAGQLPLNSFLVHASPDNCDTVVALSQFVPSAGDCVPVSSGSIDVSCGEYTLFVGTGDATGGGIYHAFPCQGANNYEVTLTATPIATTVAPAVSVQANCSDGTIGVDIAVESCLTNVMLSVADPQGLSVGSHNLGSLPACSTTQSVAGPFVETGVYTLTLTADFCGGGTLQVVGDVELVPYTNETEIIWRPAPNNPALPVGYQGTIPSETLLYNILVQPALQHEALMIERLEEFACLDELGPRDTVWAILGTYPDNHILTESEAQVLIQLLGAGVSVYIEGADIWGFDPQTSFADWDGVLGRSTGGLPFIADGDDSFTSMDGAAHATLDLTAWTDIPYFQDNTDPTVGGGIDHTDLLLPTQSGFPVAADLAGTNAGVIWRNNPDALPTGQPEAPYATAIYYIPDDICRGRVIAQSWEFGGFGGNLTDLATEYRNHLKTQQPGIGFRRGNCNDDTAVNIADAIFLLGYIFSFGTGGPPNCADACDANDDGGLNIADAISLLAALFGQATIPLAEPTCICSDDPTLDALDCLSYNSADCL